MPAALSLAEAQLCAAPLAASTRDRLTASLRHAWGGAGALTPPRLAARVADTLELAEPDGLVALVGLFYTAVDISDDVADGDAPFEARGDAERLLLWLPEAAFALDPERGSAALRLLHRGGLAMWDGQDRDLSARGRAISAAEAWSIAEGKAGEELAAVFEAVARAASVEAAPWRALGHQVGIALQVVTDLADFDSGARDWDARQPTWPLANALDHPTWGPPLRDAWAGAHRTAGRRMRGWGLVVAAHDAGTVDELCARIEELALDLDACEIVRPLLAWMAPWRSPRSFDPAPEPDLEPIAEHAEAMASATAFLRRDPTLGEAVERHERPMYGLPRVTGPIFGRLLAAWAAREAGVELPETWAELSATPAAGYRYFPDVGEVSLDTDLAGWLLTAGLGGPEVAEQLEAAVHAGLPTWLGPAWDPDGRPLTPHPCVASLVSAARGLSRVDSPHAATAWAIALDTREALGPVSPYYASTHVDALVIDAASECGVAPERWRASATELTSGAGLSGWLGDVWSTAIATPALLRHGMHPCPIGSRRALCDVLGPDGGAPATGWETVSRRGQPMFYRSRALCTAFVLRALRAMAVPQLPRCPTPPVRPLRVADV